MKIKVISAAAAAFGVTFAHFYLCVISYHVSASQRLIVQSVKEHESLRASNETKRVRNEIWRILEAKAKAMPRKDRKKLADKIVTYSRQNGHDPFLLVAMIETESSFRRDVVSRKGAVGLMQVRPFVARALAKELNMSPDTARRLSDYDVNIKLGSYYLAKMMKRFGGDLSLALEAYNLGPTRLVRNMKKGKKLAWRYTRKVFRSRDYIMAMVAGSV